MKGFCKAQSKAHSSPGWPRLQGARIGLSEWMLLAVSSERMLLAV